jgi:hypothetical protein
VLAELCVRKFCGEEILVELVAVLRPCAELAQLPGDARKEELFFLGGQELENDLHERVGQPLAGSLRAETYSWVSY